MKTLLKRERTHSLALGSFFILFLFYYKLASLPLLTLLETEGRLAAGPLAWLSGMVPAGDMIERDEGCFS